jgi:hypothetical protein
VRVPLFQRYLFQRDTHSGQDTRLTSIARCSTVAQMFSQELMDIFRIDNSVADLDEKVDKRSVAIHPCSECTAQPRQQSPAATPPANLAPSHSNNC